MKTTRTRIDGGWRLEEVPAPASNPALHLPSMEAQVPGCVHLDLQRAGVIPDPFYRLQERDAAWVDDTDWTYDTTFRLDAPPEGDVFLDFLGLDTVADISLNGATLGRADNMFIPHEFDVGPLVRADENHLTVAFHSAQRVGRERLAAWSAEHRAPPMHHSLWDARSFVRKAQYMFGWDWGPILISCGIWRPVEIVRVPVARLLDWRYEVAFAGDRATVTVEAEAARSSSAGDVGLTLVASIEGGADAVARVPTTGGRETVSVSLEIEACRRWDPSHPHLYPLHLSLRSGETTVDERSARIGLRTIELIRMPDSDGQGEGFLFRVNGEDHFCKGANWIPADSFPARSYDSEERVRPLLTAAKDVGFTMLRVWGGGLYESDTFYDLCDEMGILVWQDFPYACAYYPDDARSLEIAAAEARVAVRRLRVHPSLALWCGNNENQQMFFDNWQELNPPSFLGQAIYDTALPEVVAREDPSTPYWPGSAYGGENPNSPDAGDRHNWNVWHGEGVDGGDWPHYADDRARFCSEFGFASACGLAAWDTCLAPEDRTPTSPAVQWHKKTGKAYDIYLGYIERHFPNVRSFDDLVYFSQLNQAEAMRFGVEHYRRLKGRCWGTLIWQLNDCWPVQSWAMIDYLEEPKAVYYAARRFYAPVLLSQTRLGETLEFHLTNDLLTPVAGRLTARIARFDGTTLREEATDVELGANATRMVARLDARGLDADPREIFVHGSFAADEPVRVADTISFFAEPRDLRLQASGIHADVVDGDDGPVVTVRSDGFSAYVWLSAPALPAMTWSDNFFHLRAGEQRSVRVVCSKKPEAGALRGALRVRTLNGT